MTTHSSSLEPSSLVPDAPVTLPFAPGEIIAGKYEVLGLTGSGGVGYVVSAMHVELGELVALKFLRPQALKHPELVARFAREARAAARIKSEYVARVYDVGTLPNGEPFIVMEHLEGHDLGAVVKRHGRISIPTATEYVMQACEALASAHSLGIVHRDIKPGNLFLARRALGMETVKVLDFGISKVALSSSVANAHKAFVQTTMLMGSPVYMSPEQIRACDEVDGRTDIWSLGCVLFELLTGTCVFNAPTLMQLSAVILERDPVPLRALLPDAPPELESVIARCLEKNVAKRYQNVSELAVALFPFAPARARLSAERCVLLLNRAPANLSGEASSDTSPVSGPASLQEIEAVASSRGDRLAEGPVSSRSLSERPPELALSASIPPAPRAPSATISDVAAFRPRYRGLTALALGVVLVGGLGYFVGYDLRNASTSRLQPPADTPRNVPIPTKEDPAKQDPTKEDPPVPAAAAVAAPSLDLAAPSAVAQAAGSDSPAAASASAPAALAAMPSANLVAVAIPSSTPPTSAGVPSSSIAAKPALPASSNAPPQWAAAQSTAAPQHPTPPGAGGVLVGVKYELSPAPKAAPSSEGPRRTAAAEEEPDVGF